jgi:nitrite reductase/ring-hydroxylating ferredoxin subunit
VKKILLSALLVCFSLSCDDEIYSPIPNVPVHLEIDLDFEDSALKASLAYITFTQPRNEVEKGNLGYGGILVINGFGANTVNLYAYDLSCPVEALRNIKIKPDENGLTAVCEKCGAVFDIASGNGNPKSGTKHFLKSYRVLPSSNNRYRISN